MRIALRSRREVCHVWNSMSQHAGHAHGISFRGPDLVSYSTTIARILSSGAVAWTYRSFSPTTTQQMSSARSAANNRRSVWCYDPSAHPAENMRTERNRIAHLLRQAEQAYADKKDGTQSERSKNAQAKLRAEALSIAEQANKYLAEMLKEPNLQNMPLPIDTGNMGMFLEDLKALVTRQEAERRAKEQAERAEAAKVDLEAWRGGANISRAGFSHLPVALRLHEYTPSGAKNLQGDVICSTAEDIPVVQTSHGAEIPVADALQLWPLLLKIKERGRPFEPSSRDTLGGQISLKLGHYRLNRVDANGDITVGCHFIQFSEMEKIAEQLGLKEPA